jgi:hypothetical protein
MKDRPPALYSDRTDIGMNQKLFQAACEALWGPRYQTEAARQLGIGRSSVLRYDAGECPVPDNVSDRLIRLVIKRRDHLNDLVWRMS